MRVAETVGYRAVIEQAVLGGTGSVDVALTRGHERIACEIAVGSTVPHDVGNTRKCLAAGYGGVVTVVPDPLLRKRFSEEIEHAFTEEERRHLACVTPEEFLTTLQEVPAVAADGGNHTTIRGYRVWVAYNEGGRSIAK